jgi:hypothetical protein
MELPAGRQELAVLAFDDAGLAGDRERGFGPQGVGATASTEFNWSGLHEELSGESRVSEHAERNHERDPRRLR